ncbi:alkene reductase [Paraburkholderia caribensis]|uniref:alkene reductase n=1 Tax=Paraburkholderia caribensis TaxID=75105 RepID=UPI00078D9425|nr:alkene reductase [Paraburkholderia caribensis]AMV48483.1 hypothetical protein ATN79_48430 [Paraburkholderia caribensis]
MTTNETERIERGAAPLFSPIQLGEMELKNRIAMAPMTRSRASWNGGPTEIMSTYYDQRATAGLIISEGVSISKHAQGFTKVPGVYTKQHVDGWRRITDQVHKSGSRFVMQLWHVGRISHPDNMAYGAYPVAPSAIAYDRKVVTPSGMQQVPLPIALTREEIWSTIVDYAQAAANAIAAGCDGIEIHGANGYLPAQFLHESTNQRDDEWGGSIEKRARFLLEVTKACIEKIGEKKVGVRLSPFSVFNGATSADEKAAYGYLINALSQLDLLYLHVVTANVAGPKSISHKEGTEVPDVVGFCRSLWNGRLVAAGEYTRESGNSDLASGRADIIAFGRDFIANPDLPLRLLRGLPLAERRPSDWYGPDEKGYIDYPTWHETK